MSDIILSIQINLTVETYLKIIPEMPPNNNGRCMERSDLMSCYCFFQKWRSDECLESKWCCAGIYNPLEKCHPKSHAKTFNLTAICSLDHLAHDMRLVSISRFLYEPRPRGLTLIPGRVKNTGKTDFTHKKEEHFGTLAGRHVEKKDGNY